MQEVCSVNDISPNSGRAALLSGEGGNDKQVAIFHIKEGEQSAFFALSNYCPFAKANVLSRGITGSVNNGDSDTKFVIASPIYKQHFDLKTGICLEDESVVLQAWPVTVKDNKIFIEEADPK